MLAAAALCLAILWHSAPILSVSDAPFYVSIAQGDTAHVMQPWALRQLGALVAGALAHLLHWTIERSFLLEGVVSLLFTLGVVYWLMLRTAAPRWMLIAVAVLPSWIPLVQYLVLPDLWYAALLSVVFLLLAREQWMAAALMMFPLMLSRESTTLTLLCFLAAGWKKLRWPHWIAAVTSAAAGSLVVGRLARNSQPNVEHLPGPVYMFVKIPWNFMRNVLGIVPWSNVNMDLCKVPAWSMPFHYHDVQKVGICGFSFVQQLIAVEVILTSFGLLPLLLGFLWWKHRRFARRSFLLRFSLLYGAACLVLAPMLGAGFQHLEGYAWPLFSIALPLLFDEFSPGPGSPPASGKRAAASLTFFAFHLAACALSYWMRIWLQIFGGLALWAAGLLLLRLWWAPGSAGEPLPVAPPARHVDCA